MKTETMGPLVTSRPARPCRSAWVTFTVMFASKATAPLWLRRDSIMAVEQIRPEDMVLTRITYEQTPGNVEQYHVTDEIDRVMEVVRSGEG